MNVINRCLTVLTDFLLLPFGGMPPQIPLIFWSAVAGVVMAVVFRYTSNQRALEAVARRNKALLLGMKLFKDDLGVTLGLMRELTKYIGLRLWHSLPPMLVMVVPFVLVLTQLALRFEYRPLRVGEAVVVEMQLSQASWQQYKDLKMPAAQGVSVEAVFRDEQEHKLYWRIRPTVGRSMKLEWSIGTDSVAKHIAVAADVAKLHVVSVRRPGPGWLDRLLYPGEPGFAHNSPVQAIVLHNYPHRSIPLLGLNVPWWITFLIISILFALLSRLFIRVHY